MPPATPVPVHTPLQPATSQTAMLVQTPIKTTRMPSTSIGEPGSAVNGFVKKHPWVQQHPCGIQVRNTFIDYKVSTAGAPWSEPRSSKREVALLEASSPEGADSEVSSPPTPDKQEAASANEEVTTLGKVPVIEVEDLDHDAAIPNTPAAYVAATPTSSVCRGFAATPSSIGSTRCAPAAHAFLVPPPLPGQPLVAAPQVLRLSSYLLSPQPSRPILRLADNLTLPSAPVLSTSTLPRGPTAAPAPLVATSLPSSEEVQPRRLWFT